MVNRSGQNYLVRHIYEKFESGRISSFIPVGKKLHSLQCSATVADQDKLTVISAERILILLEYLFAQSGAFCVGGLQRKQIKIPPVQRLILKAPENHLRSVIILISILGIATISM